MTASPNSSASFPFIVARGRSGTTLLRAMFDAHPDIAIPNESHFIVQFGRWRAKYERHDGFDLERLTDDLFRHWAFRRWGLPSDRVLEAYAADPPNDFATAIRRLYATYAEHHGKSRYGDKTPSYVLSIDLLAATFPEALFIHLIRDGRDVALSYLDTDFGSRTFGQAAIYWDRFVRAGRASGDGLGPDRYREVRYEDLVRDPERILTELCAFVGLAFDERMLRYHERADTLVSGLSHKEHHRNLYRPPTVGLRDWRTGLSRHDQAVFESLAGELLAELGYETTTSVRGRAASFAAARVRFGTHVRRLAHGARIRGRKLRKRLAARTRRHQVHDQTPLASRGSTHDRPSLRTSARRSVR